MMVVTGMRQYCALWSLPPLNAADQKATPPSVTIGRRAAAAAYGLTA
jgi:hypothetical protein